MIDAGIKADFFGTDLSYKMIKTAQNNLSEYQTTLIVADMLSMPLKFEKFFDVIHMSMLLHHLIGKTRSQSFQLVDKMLNNLTKILSKNGFLVVEEVSYDSYFIPSITSSLIFYGLKFLNAFHIDLSKVSHDIQPGLEVNFFYKDHLEKILKKYGKIKILKENSSKISSLYRLLLLKKTSNVSYLVQSNDSNS